jgi:putative ABC transport system permease protein
MAIIADLDLLDLAAIGGLVAILAGLVGWLRLSLVGPLLLTTARVMVQVLMLGIFVTFIFQTPSPVGILSGSGLLLLAVSITTSNRLGPRQLLLPLGLALLLSTLLVTGYAQLFVIQGFSNQYLFPLIGILLASSPAVVISVGQTFLHTVQQEKSAIETRLSLGATNRQALQPYRRAALHQALLPVIQNLAVTGLITLPTLMAGLILAGVTPLLAAAYQIVVALMVLVHQILTAILVVHSLSHFHQHQSHQSPALLGNN